MSFSQWRSLVDGSEVSVIPDSEANQKLVHRWYLDDVETGTTTDSIGTADGTVNGVANVDGNWVGDSAGDSDGEDDYVLTTTLGDFGANMDTDFAFAFSAQFTSVGDFGVYDDDSNMALIAETQGRGGTVNGEMSWSMVDANGNTERVYTDGTTYDDGNQYRVVFNKTANAASGMEIWANQAQKTATTERSEGFSNTVNFQNAFGMFARNRGDGNPIDAHWNMILDDVCLFSDSLTQSEIESYQNPWL